MMSCLQILSRLSPVTSWSQSHVSLLLKPTLFCLLVLNFGCTTTTPANVNLPQAENWQHALEIPTEWRDHPVLIERDIELVRMTPEMQAFARLHVDKNAPPHQRIRDLYYAMSGDADGLRIKYDSSGTLTAQQAFENRYANCLGFSALFVAMAREVGVDAYFQEVDVPAIWEQMSLDTLVQYRHINVETVLPSGSWVVDFRVDRFRESYPHRRLSDAEALAHYHSNLGMEQLIADNLPEAFLRIGMALNKAPENSSLWANMGIVHRRLGNYELSEASYLHALALNDSNHSAMRNLAVLYDEQHKTAQAEQLRKLSDATRLKNPYYRYALAQNAYFKGDYNDALELVNDALRQESKEHKFYFLRGLSLQALGRNNAAVSSVKRAIKLTDKNYEQQAIENYQSQLDEWSQSKG